MTLDPITLTLTQNRLDYISRQMGGVMMRTARSPLFSQAHDFSCYITDAAGYIMAQADGVPIHTGGGGFAVRALLEAYGGDIHEGDAFILNDPYVAGGNHLPDCVISRPVFVDGRIVAVCSNRAHQSDIGGGVPGSFNSAATEIFQEGLRLPPMRLVEAGRVREDVWRMILLNSRTPNLFDGDLRAMLGSTRIGMEQVAAHVRELGEDYERYFAAILDIGDRRMRAEIAELPDGVYRGEDSTDNDCFEEVVYTVRVTLTIEGDHMTVDFTDTDPQMKGFKNSPLANTWSAVYVGLATFLSPDLPGNEGTFRAVTIVAPQGTLVNPTPPAPSTMCTLCVGSEIIHAVWRALGEADAERSCAGWGKISYPIMFGQQADGSPYVMYHWSGAIGGGAVDGRDGFNANGGLINLGGLRLPDVEFYEQSYPILFLHQGFRTDGGGSGQYRGGTGLDYAVEVETSSVLALRNEGLHSPSGFGIDGGGTGLAGEMKILCADGTEIDPPKYGVLAVDPMRLDISGAGGGGWGDPLAREPEWVLRDVRDGTVSRDAAAREYGVVLSDDGRRVEADQTEKLRAVLRSSQAAGAIPAAQ